MSDDAPRFMGLALETAARFHGRTAPNPPVGCVIVQDGRAIATGTHRAAGSDHAEVDALRQVGMSAEGADVYVTLEPCNHEGRTGPCTEALIAAGVARVFMGARDPNGAVAGGGAERLRDAGIHVVEGVLEAPCAKLIRPFARAVTTGLPFVTLKMATTLDGRVADATGARRWVTGEEARDHVHRQRDRADALLVGAGTVCADDPLLTTRLSHGRTGRTPVRAILDTHLRISPEARVVQSASDDPTIVFTAADPAGSQAQQLVQHGVDVRQVSIDSAGRVDCEQVLRALVAGGCHTVLCEGGPTVGTSLVAQRLVQQLSWFVAPTLLGAPHLEAMGAVNVGGLDAPIGLEEVEVTRLGSDTLIEGSVVYPDSAER